MNEVAITLGDEEIVLVPTLRAAKAINERFGGFTAAFERIVAFDFGAIVSIVAAGAGVRDIKAIEEKVFANGLPPLIGPVSRYVEILTNGGRAPAAGDKEPSPSKKG